MRLRYVTILLLAGMLNLMLWHGPVFAQNAVYQTAQVVDAESKKTKATLNRMIKKLDPLSLKKVLPVLNGIKKDFKDIRTLNYSDMNQSAKNRLIRQKIDQIKRKLPKIKRRVAPAIARSVEESISQVDAQFDEFKNITEITKIAQSLAPRAAVFVQSTTTAAGSSESTPSQEITDATGNVNVARSAWESDKTHATAAKLKTAKAKLNVILANKALKKAIGINKRIAEAKLETKKAKLALAEAELEVVKAEKNAEDETTKLNNKKVETIVAIKDVDDAKEELEQAEEKLKQAKNELALARAEAEVEKTKRVVTEKESIVKDKKRAETDKNANVVAAKKDLQAKNTKVEKAKDALKEANAKLKEKRKQAKDAIPKGCEDDALSLNAETECGLFADFYSGIELIGSNEFSEAFPRVGVRLRAKLGDKHNQVDSKKANDRDGWDLHRLHLVLDFGLTSRNVQGQSSSKVEATGRKALAGRGGFMLDIWNSSVSTANPDVTESNTKKLTQAKEIYYTSTLAFLGELGFNSVNDIPIPTKDGKPVGVANKPSDLLQHHFAGFRIYQRGNNRMNGAYLDIGWGASENFDVNEDKRFKVRGYIPVRFSRTNGNYKGFAAFETDSDFADSADEVKLILGLSINFEELINGFGLFGAGGKAGK